MLSLKKTGVKRVQQCSYNRTTQDWNDACVRYKAEKNKDRYLSYSQFLASSLPGPKCLHKRSQRTSLGKFLKKFNVGKLEHLDVNHARNRKLDSVEAKLFQYLKLITIKY